MQTHAEQCRLEEDMRQAIARALASWVLSKPLEEDSRLNAYFAAYEFNDLYLGGRGLDTICATDPRPRA